METVQDATVLNVYILATPEPAGVITGPAEVCAGSQGITYTVDTISNATTYLWSIPRGAVIDSGFRHFFRY